MSKRAAIYVRVSTDRQTIENQVRELRQIAERRGWEVVEQYSDAGISGSKGRDGRPGLDLMLNDAKRRKFDVVMAWAIDRLGRSLTCSTRSKSLRLPASIFTSTSNQSTPRRQWASSCFRSPARSRSSSVA